MIRSYLESRALAGLLCSLTAAACRNGPERPQPDPEPPPRGADLVVGSSAADWALLTVPHAGGPADLRGLDRPDDVIWTGRTAVPEASEAYPLDDGLVVLRSAGGEVFTYDPAGDLLERIGPVSAEAVWTSSGPAGLFFAPGSGEILEVSRAGSWRYQVDGPVTWASPAEAGILALVRSDEGPGSLWLLRQGQSTPAAEREAALSPPGLVTAWGRRVSLTDRDRPEVLRFLTVEPIESVGRVEAPGPVLALEASPSSHEMYASVDGPPAVSAVNRFTLTQRRLASLDRPASDLRSSLFGECLLAREADGVASIPVGGGDALPLPTEWRPDLPLGLPGCRVLGVRDGQMLLIEAGREPRELTLVSSADRWWLPVRWHPATARVTADRLEGQPVRDTAAVEAEAPGRVAAEPPAVERDVETPGPARPEDETPSGGPSGAPPGFYAIVGSARQEGGIAQLVASLAAAGYPTEVQRSPDDAGAVWYRGLVGPFDSRTAAEAAARQLLRERRLEAWVTEIGDSAGLERPDG